MHVFGCTLSAFIILLGHLAVSKARIVNQQPTKLWMCEQDKMIVTLYPGDKINIYGPLRRKYQTKQKCNIILQASNVNSNVSIKCWSFGVKNPTRQNKCIHFLQINSEKYCVKETPTLHAAEYSRAKLTFVTRRQFSSTGFTCSAEIPKVNETKTEIVTKIGDHKCRCGKVKYKIRVVGGVETRVRSHPWMVAIVDSLLRIPFCGGTLISDRWVMSAGHCFSWFDRLFPGLMQKVMLLEHTIGIPEGPEMIQHIKRIIVHPKYADFREGNDIALIEIWKPVNFKLSEARPICLPTSRNLYDQVKATVVGWGKTNWYSPPSLVLKEADIPTISNEKCDKVYNFKIKNNMMCAGYENRGDGGCLGDSGGPLLTQENEHYTQIGIMSWASGSSFTRPGCTSITGYTRVTSVLDWIEQTSKNGVTCNS